MVAIGTDASSVKIWNIETYQYIDVLPHVGAVTAVAFSPCGTWLACASCSKVK